ncbi:MAG: glycogen/starch/alpha-glucan family phosphorylase, partial [Nitrospinota bacterium]
FFEKVAIQINDTHPSLVITELMRILVDEEDIEWDAAWDITVKTCGYTNHTVLSEALEEWKAHMMKELLPRNYEIVEIINHDFCTSIFQKHSEDMDLIRRVSIIEDGTVRMANLAIVGSHSVNGVAELHTTILKGQLLKDFHYIFPGKFNNKTNGVTPRRWIHKANPGLSDLLTEKIGPEWLTDLSALKKIEAFVDDEAFLSKLMGIKHQNKVRLKEYILNKNPVKDQNGRTVTKIEVDPDSIFDVQAKRLHEYKRQLLNALHILMLFNEIKANPRTEVVSRTFLFAAKSAPGYYKAKGIIKFINILARIINDDPDVNGRIKVVYLENYNVSLAELLLPAGDVSEQISTAGLEASGTGNMKLAMNGSLTIGTMDGANVEMSEEIGVENMFIFGLNSKEVKETKESGYNPKDVYRSTPEIQRLVNQLWSEELTTKSEEREVLREIADALASQDPFLVIKDLMAYKEAQQKVAALYSDKKEWARRVTLNIARMGKFSSDRTIKEYNRDIWHLERTSVS